MKPPSPALSPGVVAGATGGSRIQATLPKAAFCVPSWHKPHGLCSRNEGRGHGLSAQQGHMAREAPCGDTGGRQVPCPLRLGTRPQRNNHNAHLESTPALPVGLCPSPCGHRVLSPALEPNPAQLSKADQPGVGTSSTTCQYAIWAVSSMSLSRTIGPAFVSYSYCHKCSQTW